MHEASYERIDGNGVVGRDYKPMSPRKAGDPTSLRIDPDIKILAAAIAEEEGLKGATEIYRWLVREEAKRRKLSVAGILEGRKGKK